MMGEDFYVDTDESGGFVGVEIWRASQNAIIPISKGIVAEVQEVQGKCA